MPESGSGSSRGIHARMPTSASPPNRATIAKAMRQLNRLLISVAAGTPATLATVMPPTITATA